MMQKIEQQLIDGIISKDKQAFDMLFRSYYDLLFFVARDMLRDTGVAEEITQNVFIKLWESVSTLHIKESLKSYLTKMIRNSCIDYLRSQKTRKRIHTVPLDDLEIRMHLLTMEEDDSSDEALFSSLIEEKLKSAIGKLSPQCRQIFEMNRFEGKSYKEIAETLQISVSTVKTQMSRAFQKMKDAII